MLSSTFRIYFVSSPTSQLTRPGFPFSACSCCYSCFHFLFTVLFLHDVPYFFSVPHPPFTIWGRYSQRNIPPPSTLSFSVSFVSFPSMALQFGSGSIILFLFLPDVLFDTAKRIHPRHFFCFLLPTFLLSGFQFSVFCFLFSVYSFISFFIPSQQPRLADKKE